MKEYTDEELIDAFLKKRLNLHQKAQLEEKLAKDPAFALELKESEEIFGTLQHYRLQKLKEGLREKDLQLDKKSKSIRRRILIALAILVTLSAVLWIEWRSYCKPENIAARYYIHIESEGLDDVNRETRENFIAASSFFEKGDYENAAHFLQTVTGHHKLSAHAKWNLLMCHLAMTGPDEYWQHSFNGFLNSTEGRIQEKAVQLSEFLQSLFYRLGARNSPILDAVKPRLI